MYIDMLTTYTVHRYASNIYYISPIVDSMLTLPLYSTKCFLTKLFISLFPVVFRICVWRNFILPSHDGWIIKAWRSQLLPSPPPVKNAHFQLVYKNNNLLMCIVRTQVKGSSERTWVIVRTQVKGCSERT